MGSQCNFLSSDVICSILKDFVTTRAAGLCDRWSL